MSRLTHGGALCALLAFATTVSAGELAGITRPTQVFASPSEAGAPAGQAQKGDTYAVSRQQGEWVEIQFTERKAWVQRVDAVVSEAALKRTTANLNVRTGPSTQHTILATLPRGTWVAERGGNGVWRMISFKGRTAWVYGAYLARERDPLGGKTAGGAQQPWYGAEAPSGESATPARSRTPLSTTGPGASLGEAVGSSAQRQQRAASEQRQPEQKQQPWYGGGANRTAIFQATRNEGQRNQLKSGTITINDRAYTFRSGGYGRGNLPPGEYRVTPHMWSRSESSYSVAGVGYTFALSDKYDPRVGGTRQLLRIHPDGGVAGTEGCIGIVGDAETQRRFREDMRAELNRSGGSFTLSVREGS